MLPTLTFVTISYAQIFSQFPIELLEKVQNKKEFSFGTIKREHNTSL